MKFKKLKLNNYFANNFIKEIIQNAPSTINIEDLSDFNTLCQHFAAKTPQSFRKVC